MYLTLLCIHAAFNFFLNSLIFVAFCLIRRNILRHFIRERGGEVCNNFGD